MRRLLASAALAAALSAQSAAAFDIGAMTEEERSSFQAEVRAYLLEHPEVLNEMVAGLESRQAAQQAEADVALIDANRDVIFDDPASWVGGNPEGSITLVEFVDYRCGYCRKAYADVAELVGGDGDIRFVIKEFPILGPESDLSARFAIATLQVAGPEAYEKVHNAFYTDFRGEVTPDTLAAFATSLGIDPAPILAKLDAPEVTKIIDDNHALAQRLQINGTPGFVMGDKLLRGYVPLQGMQAMLADLRG